MPKSTESPTISRREGSERYGAMVRSRFMKLGNNTLYFSKTGDAIVNKVVKIGSAYYAFNERGYRQHDTFWDYNGGTYYLGSDGKAYTGGSLQHQRANCIVLPLTEDAIKIS